MTRDYAALRRQLLDAIAEIEPLIREHADYAEETTRLAPPVVKAMTDAGVFRMVVPRSLGGLEVDYETQVRVIEAVGKIDGGTGWCAFLGGVNPAFAMYLPDAGAEEMFLGHPEVVTGGTPGPAQRALRVDGGYICNGRWPFGSGSPHCHYLMGGCLVYEGDEPRLTPDGKQERRVFWFKKSELILHHTWITTGLRGSGSHDFEANDLFVPDSRAGFVTAADMRMAETREPRGKHFQGPLYHIPFFCHSGAAIAGVALGITRHALDLFSEMILKKPKRAIESHAVRDRGYVQVILAEAEATWHSARAFFYQTAREIWQEVEERGAASTEAELRMKLAKVDAVQRCAHAVTMVQKAGGGSSVYLKNGIDRCFRDVHTATQHMGVYIKNYEDAGAEILDHRRRLTDQADSPGRIPSEQ